MSGSMRSLFEQDGFTIVELSVVMVLVIVMGAVALPKFFGVSSYKVASAKSDIISLTRFAQESALNISDTRDPDDATHDLQRVRVQMVFAPDADPALSQVRVEVGQTLGNCAVITTPTVLRSVPMLEGIVYPSPAGGRIQFDPLGALECPANLEFDLDQDTVTDICIESSGFAHLDACY